MIDKTRIATLKSQALRAFEAGDVQSVLNSFEAFWGQHLQAIGSYQKKVAHLEARTDELNEEKASLTQKVEELSSHATSLEVKATSLAVKAQDLEAQLAWFKRQIFGRKSERRILASDTQMSLGELSPLDETRPDEETTVITYARKARRKDPLDGAVLESGLRFDASVPVEVIEIKNPEVADLSPNAYEVIGTKETYKLAQRPGAYVVLKYVRQVIKLKSTQAISCPKAPENVLDKSFADVSFLAGLLVDKFVSHLPLYRQHQRLTAAGIKVSRGTLTKLVKESIGLLEPLYYALYSSILQSPVIAMDETPIKAGRDANKHQMKKAYFWPIYGQDDEVAFIFSPTRSKTVVEETLTSYGGTLLSDGYAAYDSFIQAQANPPPITHALCYAHVRREFVKASESYPAACKDILDLLAALYRIEQEIKDQSLTGQATYSYRNTYSLSLVDQLFANIKVLHKKHTLLPSSPLTKAMNYTLKREAQLRVFLSNPDVPIDTNHLERQIRPIAIGRKNWLFCWTELGARDVAIIQSLIQTARLHQINPYVYLVDVLQRVHTHKAIDVHLLTPKHWKDLFAQHPITSNLSR